MAKPQGSVDIVPITECSIYSVRCVVAHLYVEITRVIYVGLPWVNNCVKLSTLASSHEMQKLQ